MGKGHGRAQQKATLSRAPLALTVSYKFSINLSALGGEQGEIRVGEGGGGWRGSVEIISLGAGSRLEQ